MVLLYNRMLGAGEDYRSMIDANLEDMNYGNGFGDNGKPCKPAKSPRALKGVDLILQVHLWNLSTVSWLRTTVEV